MISFIFEIFLYGAQLALNIHNSHTAKQITRRPAGSNNCYLSIANLQLFSIFAQTNLK